MFSFRILVSAAAATAVLAGGCAGPGTMTPAQVKTTEAFERCKKETNASNVWLARVSPEGQPYFEASQTPSDANRVIDCMYPGWRERQR